MLVGITPKVRINITVQILLDTTISTSVRQMIGPMIILHTLRSAPCTPRRFCPRQKMNCFRIAVAIEFYLFRAQNISERSHNSRIREKRIIQDLGRALTKCGALKQHHVIAANTIYISNVFSNLLLWLLSQAFSIHVKHDLHKKACVGIVKHFMSLFLKVLCNSLRIFL